jgi:hypothetical protein
MLGLDQECYANLGADDQTFGVVMAVDLLEDWPAVDNLGRITGFQPYTSHLTPNQIVLGYPMPDTSGTSDGAPVTSTTAIKNTIMCLATATQGCALSVYVPPRAYGMVGGVFGWEISFDQNNMYRFARTLSPCVKNGVCV